MKRLLRVDSFLNGAKRMLRRAGRGVGAGRRDKAFGGGHWKRTDQQQREMSFDPCWRQGKGDGDDHLVLSRVSIPL